VKRLSFFRFSSFAKEGPKTHDGFKIIAFPEIRAGPNLKTAARRGLVWASCMARAISVLTKEERN
jgi:hypothetical protein